MINGQPYVDGGTCSPASVDVLADADLDEVWVLAPMASFALDRPRSPVARGSASPGPRSRCSDPGRMI
jgi:NTE family protein